MFPRYYPFLAFLITQHVALAQIPQVDFDRMGTVGLAGAFAGLDLFTNSSTSFDPSTSTLLSRASDGSLTRIASTNSGGNIVAGCALDNIFYLAGEFSTINGVSASNIASYTPSSSQISPVATNGPNGQINTLFCDSKENKLWVGGSFSSPGASIAIYDPRSQSWSPAPFQGISGAQARVDSITTNSSQSSLFFSGSFVTNFGNGNVVLNGTNNPNVPFSAGASPFSSSLVPVPLAKAQVDGSPSSSQSGFDDINNILCPNVQDDGPGNSWFAADSSTPLITVRTFQFLSASGVRLGNTFLGEHGTTGFSVTTIPDNNVRTLQFVDPTTGQNQTCRDPCPLSTDSSILYQDFLFGDGPIPITGVQIKLSSFTGSGPGLHILQLLSSGAFASSIPAENGISCFATGSSNTTQTGNWTPVEAKTDIPGTVQRVLVANVAVGTPANQAPSFTWIPYVSASGNYDVNMLVPGCVNFADCAQRTSVKVTVFVGPNQPPFITTISQQNQQDATVLLYSGPLLPSSPDFVAPITMTLDDSPSGNGQNGQFALVADRVELVLRSATATSGDGTSSNNVAGLARGFGFLEWDRSATSVMNNVDGRKVFPNSTLSGLDAVGFDLLAGLGGISGLTSSDLSIKTVAHHSSGIYLAGTFKLNAGPASGASNVVVFKNGALANVKDNGLNGAVAASFVFGDQIFVGGSFTNTASGSSQGLNNVAVYDASSNTWNGLLSGVNGPVFSLNVLNGQLQITGNFTQILTTTGNAISAAGFAMWDISSKSWVNNGGFVVGAMTFIGNGTDAQYLAGNVQASQRFGATGMVMLKNGDSNGPAIAPLSIDLTPAVNASSAPGTLRKRHIPSATAFLSHINLSRIFARQTPPAQQSLAPSLPAPGPAVLAGAFWTNSSSSKELTILGGNFSFVASGSLTVSQAVAIYDPSTGTALALSGPQINGIVRTLLVDENSLYIGGEFTISGATVNGLALYDLSKNEWDFDSIQALQPSSGSAVVVRSITKSTFKSATVIVAGSFANAGALRCVGICSYDTTTNQWNALGDGIQGEVADVAYANDDLSVLVAGGSLSLSGSGASNVLQYSLENSTWAVVGSGSDIPGPVSAIEVNNKNASSIFAAGSSDGNAFLAFWNGDKWTTLDSTLADGTTVAQLTMVPLQNTHAGNSIIQSDRMLMISGLLSTSAGNASSALFDGENVIPYIVSTSSTGSTGTVSSLFHSFSSFSFDKRRILATGVVILISIAIAAGIVFLLALIGILWTLFSRKDDKLNKFDNAEEEDDDSQHHRPSSLLEHINAATRTTILGAGGPYSPYSSEREEEKVTGSPREGDPFVADGSNYVRAETPSDAMGGMLAEESSRLAHARYSFDGTGEGELPISAGAEVEVLDDRDAA
ncbi:cortical protein marker for cell polarity-domain-containing protein [Panaeolus papilionaceus]|nr:cortical protein marker for cell polarity-domain-containing protein [Panaeolus papilionaceus]